MNPITATRATLGEGAIWYGDALYWVDITEKRVYIYDPKSNSERMIQLDSMVGTVVPRKQGGLAVALQTGFALLDSETGETTPIADPEADKPHTRFNDGKCDPKGRFWAGTMAIKEGPNQGALYMLDGKGNVSKKVDNVSISNGICWSLDARTMYYIDTPTYQVVAYDYDNETGDISNPRTVIEIDRSEGGPDGMTIDERGYLWIALWGGYSVVCHDPNTGKRHAKVDVPAANVTSCAFGGDDLSDLYITSARQGNSPEALEKQPHAGGLFRVNVGVRGVPAFAFEG